MLHSVFFNFFFSQNTSWRWAGTHAHTHTHVAARTHAHTAALHCAHYTLHCVALRSIHRFVSCDHVSRRRDAEPVQASLVIHSANSLTFSAVNDDKVFSQCQGNPAGKRFSLHRGNAVKPANFRENCFSLVKGLASL